MKKFIVPKFYLNFSKTEKNVTVGMKGDSDTEIHDTVNGSVENKVFTPESITSEGLFGLKESIVKAKKIKQELKEQAEEAKRKTDNARFLLVITYILIFGIFMKRFKVNYKTCQDEEEEANNVYKNFKLDIDFNMDESMLNEYTLFKNSFEQVTSCRRIWDITATQFIDRVKERSSTSISLTRASVRFFTGKLDYINTKHEAFKFQNANGSDLYIYPGFIFMPSERNNDLAIIDFRDITLVHNEQQFVERGGVPSDAKVVGRTWQYVNKNGMPDKRYKDNPEIPVVLYYELVLKSSKGLYESYQFSSADIGEKFCATFENYRQSLNNMKWDKE
jgi:hypothetical protein